MERRPTRPTITSLPSTIAWGGVFTVTTPDAANISSVVLVRPGAPTHAFDTEQRVVGMSFTKGSGTLTVTAPPNGNIAPPGYYMLFLLNSSGVPSVAKFTKLGSSTGNPAPTVSSISPSSGTANGDAGDHYGHRLPGGSDGEPGWNGRHWRDGVEQHFDHSYHCGAHRGRGNVVVTNPMARAAP